MKKNWLLAIAAILLMACSGLFSPVPPTLETISPTPSIAATSTPIIITPTVAATAETSSHRARAG